MRHHPALQNVGSERRLNLRTGSLVGDVKKMHFYDW
jgi:hypothetical protein